MGDDMTVLQWLSDQRREGNISTQLYNCISRQIENDSSMTVAELSEKNDNWFSVIPNLGPKSLAVLRELLPPAPSRVLQLGLNESPNIRQLQLYQPCQCGKPSAGILRGIHTENFGPHCKSCANKRIKNSAIVRNRLAKVGAAGS